MAKVIAWYFSTDDKKLRYDDGRMIEVGKTHRVKGRPELCIHGLHASENIRDALSYATGNTIWLVELSGRIDRGDDKLCATSRKYIAGGVNIESTLRAFARSCARDVLHLWDAPDVVKEYLRTGKESIRDAASAAAWDAALGATLGTTSVAAWGAVWGAESAAASAATLGAAWGVASAAARDSTLAAARDAASAAAWAAQSKRLESMVLRRLGISRREYNAIKGVE